MTPNTLLQMLIDLSALHPEKMNQPLFMYNVDESTLMQIRGDIDTEQSDRVDINVVNTVSQDATLTKNKPELSIGAEAKIIVLDLAARQFSDEFMKAIRHRETYRDNVAREHLYSISELLEDDLTEDDELPIYLQKYEPLLKEIHQLCDDNGATYFRLTN